MLLTAAHEEWRFACASLNQSPQSLRWKDQKLAAFIAWCADQDIRDVEGVTVPVTQRFLLSLSGSLSDYTRRGYAQCLKAFLNYCAREDLVSERLPKRVPIPKVTDKVIETLTPRHIKLLLAATDGESTPALRARDRAILAVLLDAGLRADELLGLTLENVHFGSDTYVQVLGKGRKQRQVGLGDKSRMELHRYIHRHREAPSAEHHVFLSRYHQPMTLSGLDQVLYRLRDWAGAAQFAGIRVSAHTFRHTFAVAYLSSGGDVYKLSRLLGHASVTTTEVYLRALTQKAARQGLSVFDAL